MDKKPPPVVEPIVWPQHVEDAFDFHEGFIGLRTSVPNDVEQIDKETLHEFLDSWESKETLRGFLDSWEDPGPELSGESFAALFYSLGVHVAAENYFKRVDQDRYLKLYTDEERAAYKLGLHKGFIVGLKAARLAQKDYEIDEQDGTWEKDGESLLPPS